MTISLRKARPKTCKNPECGKKFVPKYRTTEKACSPACALIIGKADAGIQKQARKSIADRQRKEIKIRREKLKSGGDHLREAQQAFNEFIRWRDRLAGHSCISSGLPLDWSGNQTDAGHYRSTGAAPHLRFDERNCHAQRKLDNRYLSGNAVDYRVGLIARIGLAAVEALEADNTVRKYTIEDLKAIKAHYRAKVRELKRKTA